MLIKSNVPPPLCKELMFATSLAVVGELAIAIVSFTYRAFREEFKTDESTTSEKNGRETSARSDDVPVGRTSAPESSHQDRSTRHDNSRIDRTPDIALDVTEEPDEIQPEDLRQPRFQPEQGSWKTHYPIGALPPKKNKKKNCRRSRLDREKKFKPELKSIIEKESSWGSIKVMADLKVFVKAEQRFCIRKRNGRRSKINMPPANRTSTCGTTTTDTNAKHAKGTSRRRQSFESGSEARNLSDYHGRGTTSRNAARRETMGPNSRWRPISTGEVEARRLAYVPTAIGNGKDEIDDDGDGDGDDNFLSDGLDRIILQDERDLL